MKPIFKVLEQLYSLESKAFALDLGPITMLSAALGDPHTTVPCIHIAGTNGKGSTAYYLFSLLCKAGYKVGLYTSPHLSEFNERIRVNENHISDEDIVKLFTSIKETSEKQHISASFFEISTLMAMMHFSNHNCDLAIYETGLGGRLDATNIVTPLLCIITTIGLEHQQYLGDTIEKIATEKAGIIKQGIPVVSGAKGKAQDVIMQVGKEKNAQVHTINTQHSVQIEPEYQQHNVSLALTALDILHKQYHLRKPANAERVIQTTIWNGRYEWVDNVLFDGAHNPPAINALAQSLQHKSSSVVAVISILTDKDAAEMIAVLDSFVDTYVFTTCSTPRARDPQELASMTSKPSTVIADPHQALTKAKQLAKDSVVIVTGSLYIVGDLLPKSVRSKDGKGINATHHSK